jgi:spore maturation protein CgeB
MKILLYGENWEGTHVDSIAKVLLNKKIEYRIFDFHKIIYKNYNSRILNKFIREIYYTRNEKLVNELFIKVFNDFKPNVVLISKGVNLFPETIFELQKQSAKVVNWNPDDFFNVYNSSEHLLNSLSLYDTVYSARQHLFQEYRDKGIKNPVYLEWYYIPWLHDKKVSVKSEILPNVTFVGTYSRRRQEIISSINGNFKIQIWGSGWDRTRLRYKNNIIINNVLSQSEFTNVMSSTSINLNILTLENRDETNLKVFEIPASNGFLLTEKTNAIRDILNPEIDCMFFDPLTKDSINEKIESVFEMSRENYLLMRNRGYNNIISNKNSIVDRVEFILKDLKL